MLAGSPRRGWLTSTPALLRVVGVYYLPETVSISQPAGSSSNYSDNGKMEKVDFLKLIHIFPNPFTYLNDDNELWRLLTLTVCSYGFLP